MSKTIYILLALLFVSTALPAAAPQPGSGSVSSSWLPASFSSLPRINNGLEQLNQSMQTTLRLSPEQFRAIRKANRSFWKERQAILDEPGKIARHTALLAAWDRWSQELQTVLDKYQYKAFLKWQYEVSPLSERPY